MTETTTRRGRAVNEGHLASLESLAAMWERCAGSDDGSWYGHALRTCARQLREVADEIRCDLDLPVPYLPAGRNG